MTSQRGYSLVVLLVAVTVLNIVVAAALPYWSKAMQREREEELIFRGLQYAEGIRLYQRRFGQLPTSLDQLVEVEPRCMRQLYDDPFSDDGKWELVFANAPNAGNPNQPNNPNAPNAPNQPNRQGGTTLPGSGGSGLDGETVTTGPIVGVRSRSEDESILVWNGEESHDRWLFTVDLVSAGLGGGGGQGTNPAQGSGPNGRPLVPQPGQPGQQPANPASNPTNPAGGLGGPGGGGQVAPGALINLRWLGRPLPEGAQVPGMPGSGQPGVQDGNLPGNAGNLGPATPIGEQPQ